MYKNLAIKKENIYITLVHSHVKIALKNYDTYVTR